MLVIQECVSDLVQISLKILTLDKDQIFTFQAETQ